MADRLFRIANRLGKVPAGSVVADRTIHKVLDLAGPVLPYTREEAAARLHCPPGIAGVVVASASGERPVPRLEFVQHTCSAARRYLTLAYAPALHGMPS